MGILDGLLRRPKKMTAEEYMEKMLKKGIDEHGNFVVDKTPMAPPIGYKKQPSMVEMVREMVRGERLAAEALAAGHETFEESEDFDIEDDPSFAQSPWENDFDPPLKELIRAGQDEIQKKARDKTPPPKKEPEKAPEPKGESPPGV